VISSKASTVWNRRPADVGFSFLTGIVLVLSSGVEPYDSKSSILLSGAS
jgi:hypothetical protein